MLRRYKPEINKQKKRLGSDPIKTASVTVEDNRYIAGLTTSMPEIYSGVDAEVAVSAVDQYGDAFTDAELYALGLTQTNTKTITFGDT